MEQVSLLRVESYQEDLVAKTTQLLQPLGGLQFFCHRGEKVLLKPNFIMARTIESATTTHPGIILALVKLLKDIGCKVAIGDSPGIGSTVGVVNKLGLTNDLKRYGVKVIELETAAPISPTRTFSFERRFKNLQLAKELDDYNQIINLPKLKTHGQMGLSLATKNLFGCVAGHGKVQWHYAIGNDPQAFGRLLVEIALSVNASLHLLDGIIAMDGNGPSNGRPRKMGVLLAGVNPLAVDRVVVEMISQKPEHFPIFWAADNLRLPWGNFNEIAIKGEAISTCRVDDFEIPSFKDLHLFESKICNNIVAKLVKQRLILDQKRCIKCRKCEVQCLAKAITFNKIMQIDQNRCIRCCCCQEICPVGALSISIPFGVRILRKLKLM